MGYKLLKFILSMTIIISITVAPSFYNQSFGLEARDSKKEELQKKNEVLKQKLSETKDQIDKQEEYKKTLDDQIGVTIQQVEFIESQINSLDSDIVAKIQRIQNIQVDVDKNKELLKQRMVVLYKSGGDVSTLKMLFNSKNSEDFLSTLQVIEVMSKSTSEIITKLKEQTRKISLEKDEVERKKIQISEDKKQLDTKKSELQTLINESEQILQSLHQTQAKALEDIDLNSSEIQSIDAQIATEQKKRMANMTVSAPKNNSASKGSYSAAPVVSATGGYLWPTPQANIVTSEFNEWRGRSIHGGLDISGPNVNGTPIVAVDNGVVILACSDGQGGGYGNYVVIDHGNGKSTLYGHQSSIAVSYGQSVSKGQVIGYIGSTGYSTGPHLHFETKMYNAATGRSERYDPRSEY